MSLASRLTALSYDQLLELVVSGCEESAALKNRADALVAEAKPMSANVEVQTLETLDRDTLGKILVLACLRAPERLHPSGFYWSANTYQRLRNASRTLRAVLDSASYKHALCTVPAGRVTIAEALSQLPTCISLDATFSVRCYIVSIAARPEGSRWRMLCQITDTTSAHWAVLSDEAVQLFRGSGCRLDWFDEIQEKDVYEPFPPKNMQRFTGRGRAVLYTDPADTIAGDVLQCHLPVTMLCKYVPHDHTDWEHLSFSRRVPKVTEDVMSGHHTFRLRCIGLQAVGHEEHFDFSPEGQNAPVQRHMDWQAEGLALLKDIKELCAAPWCEQTTKKLMYPPGTKFLPVEEEEDEGDDFYESMFENFAADPDDDECTTAYWTEGMTIVRERDPASGRWVYTCHDRW